MPERSLERFTDRATEESLERHSTTPSTESDLPDLESTRDGGLAFVGKTKNSIGSAETKVKAKQRKTERKALETEEGSAEEELGIEEVLEATEEETKAVLLREAQIAANKLIPNLYIGEQRRVRERALNEEIESLGLALAKAKLDDDKRTIDKIRERRIPLDAELDRFFEYATAEEEVEARIKEMEALRERLKAGKRRASHVEATLENLREVQTKLTEARTWENAKEAANQRRNKAYEELRTKKAGEKTQERTAEEWREAEKEIEQFLKEETTKGYNEDMEDTEAIIGGGRNRKKREKDIVKTLDRLTKRSTIVGDLRNKKLQPGAQYEAAEQKLQENLDTITSVFKNKYGGDIARAARGEETFAEKAVGWWKDSRVGKLFGNKKTETYGGVDRDKAELIERYNRLLSTYGEIAGRPKRTSGDVIRELSEWHAQRDNPPKQAESSNTSSESLLKGRKAVAKEVVRPLAEMAIMPILAIAEPILSKRRWEREWTKMQGEHDAELFNEIAESILDKHNEDALTYVAEATGIAPWELTKGDVAEFFYTTTEGDKLREELMSKLRKEMEQREKS